MICFSKENEPNTNSITNVRLIQSQEFWSAVGGGTSSNGCSCPFFAHAEHKS